MIYEHVTTNDVYVNLAWIKSVEECTDAGSTRIAVISDGDGDAVKELGLAADMGFGMGTRVRPPGSELGTFTFLGLLLTSRVRSLV